jgi:hypothetical protein
MPANLSGQRGGPPIEGQDHEVSFRHHEAVGLDAGERIPKPESPAAIDIISLVCRWVARCGDRSRRSCGPRERGARTQPSAITGPFPL